MALLSFDRPAGAAKGFARSPVVTVLWFKSTALVSENYYLWMVAEAGGKPNKKRKRDEWVDKSNGSAVPAAAPVAEDAGAIQRCTYAKPIAEARGHTGYLTFARRSVDADDGSDSEESDQGVDEAGDEEDL